MSDFKIGRPEFPPGSGDLNPKKDKQTDGEKGKKPKPKKQKKTPSEAEKDSVNISREAEIIYTNTRGKK